MTSVRYKRMVKQIRQLREALLPRDLSKSLLDFSTRISARALSFRVLCHAELESYLEDRAIEVAMAADSAWKARGHVSRTTLCLLAFSGHSLQQLPATLKAPPKKKQKDWDELIKPDKRLGRCISAYRFIAESQNHGIKEENIISLLLPIGFQPDALDEILVSELTDLGSKRGQAAHSSSAGQLTKGVNPKDENDQVTRILDGLKVVDAELDRLLADAS